MDYEKIKKQMYVWCKLGCGITTEKLYDANDIYRFKDEKNLCNIDTAIDYLKENPDDEYITFWINNYVGIRLDESQEKLFNCTNATKVEDTENSSKRYIYVFKLSEEFKNEEKRKEICGRLSEFDATNFGYGLYPERSYKTINDKKIKDTRVFDEELYIILQQLHNEISAEEDKEEVSLFHIKSDKISTYTDYKITYRILSNLLPKKMPEKPLKIMANEEREIVKNHNIEKIGLDLTLPERKALEVLLFIIAHSGYVYEKEAVKPIFRISMKDLLEVIGHVLKAKHNKYRIVDTIKNLADRIFLWKLRVKGISRDYYKPDKIFTITQEGTASTDFIIEFSNTFIGGFRRVEDSGAYYTKREINFYGSIKATKNNSCAILLDYVNYLRQQDRNPDKKIRDNPSTLLEKLEIDKLIEQQGYDPAVQQLNYCFRILHELDYIDEPVIFTVAQVKLAMTALKNKKKTSGRKAITEHILNIPIKPLSKPEGDEAPEVTPEQA